MKTFSEQFLVSFAAMLRRRHGFGVTHLAILCVMGSDKEREFGRSEMARIIGMTELTTRNAMRRLDLEGFTEKGRLLPYGEATIGMREFPFLFRPVEIPPEAARR